MKRKIIGIVLAAVLAGCSTSGSLPSLALTPEEATYRLGSGDQLKITVYGEERLTGTFPVNGQGILAYPLLGEIPAKGKTLRELEQQLTAGLSDGFVNNPSVTVEVANYRPYYILGEVAKPGEYQYSNGLTVFSAVARAGGFTYRADQKRVYIHHKAAAEETKYRLEGNTPVQPGDTIRIGERIF
jgi:polysaccharide biosynthesis/export protein